MHHTHPITGESVVLAGARPAKLLGTRIVPDSVDVRGTYLPGGTRYEPGTDYVLDADAGTVARTLESRIPDFSTNVLYGKEPFDHRQFPGYGNSPFTVYIDYAARDLPRLTEPTDQASRLARSRAKLEGGGVFKVIAFGDSITAGVDASGESVCFPNRFTKHLGVMFPSARVTIENGATGGDNTVKGLSRLEEKVLSRHPDLVLVGFGMNDHNVDGVPVDQFRANLEAIIQTIRRRTKADVILYSAFPPNPAWVLGTARMDQYANATEQAASEAGVAYADVYSAWSKALSRKDPPSLLANNINHPNDFGHWLYFEVLRTMKF